MDRWFEVSGRRSRLRSASRMLASPNTPSRGTKRIRETGSVTDNAGDERHPKPQRRADDCAEDDDTDPEYRLFLEHLKPYRKSYVFEMRIGDAGTALCLKYEEEDDDSFSGDSSNTNPSKKRSPSSSSSDLVIPISIECAVECSEVDEDYQIYLNRVRVVPDSMECEVGCSEVDEDYQIYLNRVRVVPDSMECEVGCSEVDDDYQIFLDHAREYNRLMILELDDNVIVRYEEESDIPEKREHEEINEEESAEELHKFKVKTEDSEEKSNLPNSKTTVQPYSCSPQPSNSLVDILLACKDDGCPMENEIPSQFKDRLMGILQKPFDQSEYDNLLSQAITRTPKKKLKHLRTMSKAYETNEMGYSYYDYYPTLAKLMKSANYQAGLRLLRGFFFWLENLVHDGAFRPWLSSFSSCCTLASSSCNPMLPYQIEVSDD